MASQSKQEKIHDSFAEDLLKDYPQDIEEYFYIRYLEDKYADLIEEYGERNEKRRT